LADQWSETKAPYRWQQAELSHRALAPQIFILRPKRLRILGRFGVLLLRTNDPATYNHF